MAIKEKKRILSAEEKAVLGKFGWLDVFKSIWYFLDTEKPSYLFFNILLFVVLFYDIVPAFVMGKVVDFFTKYHSGDSLAQFYGYAIFLGGSWIVISVTRLVSKNELSKISIAARARAKVLGFERLMDSSLKWHSQENTGNKVQRILTGSQAISEWTRIASQNIFPIVTVFIAVLSFFLFTNRAFLVFLLSYTVIFFTIQYLFSRKMERLSLEYDKAFEISSGAFFEGTGNILSIKALGAEKQIHSNIKEFEERAKQLQFELTTIGNKKWRFFQVLSGLSFSLFIILVGHQILVGEITVGLILVYYSYFQKLRDMSSDTTDVTSAAIGFKADLARMMPIFKDDIGIKTGNKKFPINWKEISLSNATFLYPSEQVGFKDLNLTIKKGDRIGIAGSSGGGKSSLVKVLLDLYGLGSGNFKIDGENYYEISHTEIIQNISVVLQETELFNFSLRDNITLMRSFNSDLFFKAINIAGLGEVIKKLSDGLDTKVGEKGYSLSGGERQRVGIARAIYKNAAITIFDEATSALDGKLEHQIIQKLSKEFDASKTLIFVAHRVSVLQNLDRILVFDKGELVEEGKFSLLITKPNSQLNQLYSVQKT